MDLGLYDLTETFLLYIKEMLWRDSCYSFLMIYILNVYMLESR